MTATMVTGLKENSAVMVSFNGSPETNTKAIGVMTGNMGEGYSLGAMEINMMASGSKTRKKVCYNSLERSTCEFLRLVIHACFSISGAPSTVIFAQTLRSWYFHLGKQRLL